MKRISCTTWTVIIAWLFLMAACRTASKEAPLFEVLGNDQTGLSFNNHLRPDGSVNMLKYMYFYNGAGVGAGDFNNDGQIDLFFAANQSQNRLYLNKGALQFSDATPAAGIPRDSSWSTGVSVVDINNDGLLDIYVCRVGNFETLQSRNQLLVCQQINTNGIPVFKDEAAAYGLDFSGFSTQSAFLDYDLDGDLDMYLMNHSLRYNSTYAPRASYNNTFDSLSGDRLYRNDGGHFTNVTRESGIHSSVIGYGLGVAVSDIDLDGYPDIYIGNDFHENDYLYINQHNGTFKEVLTEATMHTSQFSMGVDVGDVNNDAFPEIISMDMLPSDPYILKRSLGEDEYNVFQLKVKHGYHYQYARNTLQLNRKNGLFSEIGLYAGVYATDWSWAPLWIDFDNDGWKDLFVSNGIPKRLNDIDYVNFISNEQVQQQIRSGNWQAKDEALMEKFPAIKLPNRFFRNKGQAAFDDVGSRVENNLETFSNGTVYADFDNDGDLDIVVNNIDQPALLYRNASNDKKDQRYLQVKLKGPASNVSGTGSKLVVFAGEEIRTYEKYGSKGFQSGMEIPFHVGLQNTKVDSLLLIWPDNTWQPLRWQDTAVITVQYQKGLPLFDYAILKREAKNDLSPVQDITKQTGIQFRHEENHFVEFDREPLIPHMVSTEGPALAVADINGDGREDVFIGAAKGKKNAVLLQDAAGKFHAAAQPDLASDSTFEDVDACWVDVNNDQFPDLVIASGGNEFYGQDAYLLPRVYVNDGKGKLTRLKDAFHDMYMTASCVVPYDFTGDGFMDLFIGGRAVPYAYGEIPRSYLLANDGTGKFKDVTAQYAKDLLQPGMVTHGRWLDLDKDGDQDLVITMEWDGIVVFSNNKGSFAKKYLTQKKGWWNFTLPCDVDQDGDIDLIAGNLGWNSRLRASRDQPVHLYYFDFDGNGRKEQVLTYYLAGREIPFANKGELEKQLPVLKKQFLYADQFAKASLEDLFTKEKLQKAAVLSADYFANALLINNGRDSFEVKPLPWDAQLTTFRDAIVTDANNDGQPDVFLGGNYFDSNIQMGRYDADFGTILINRGKGNFGCERINGMVMKGQVRRIRAIQINNKPAFIVAKNNDSATVITAPNRTFLP